MLNAMNVQDAQAPWALSFSYARALQQAVLEAWRGRRENAAAAQSALLVRAKLNAAARAGRYRAEMEAAR